MLRQTGITQIMMRIVETMIIWLFLLLPYIMAEDKDKSADKPKEPAKAQQRPSKWSGTMEGNKRQQIADRETHNAMFKFDVYRDSTYTKLYLGLFYIRVKTDEVLTSFNRRGEVKGEYKLTNRFSGYLQQILEDNQARKLELLSRLSFGMGYHFLKQPNLKHSLYLGGTYTSEEYLNRPTIKRTHGYQVSNSFKCRYKSLELMHKYNYLPRSADIKEYKTRSDGSIRLYLSQYLYVGFSLINEYDNKPVVTGTHHSATSLLTIGYKF
jgi:hypothetical protein